MNKGLIISHLNRAIAAGDAVKEKKYQDMLDEIEVKKTDTPNETIENEDNAIITAINRLNEITKIKGVVMSFLSFDNQAYNRNTILELETIDLEKCVFFKRNSNGTTEQVHF